MQFFFSFVLITLTVEDIRPVVCVNNFLNLNLLLGPIPTKFHLVHFIPCNRHEQISHPTSVTLMCHAACRLGRLGFPAEFARLTVNSGQDHGQGLAGVGLLSLDHWLRPIEIHFAP